MLQEDQTLKKFVEISVIDTGIGIEYEDQDKLFKLFGFVQDTQGLNTHGIGLGLVIAEQIVKQFGGKIFFESVPKEGTTFTFTFELDEHVDEEAEISDGFNVNSCELEFQWTSKKQAPVKYVGEMNLRQICE